MSACASLACDACPKPARCCAGFELNSERLLAKAAPTALHAMVALQRFVQPHVDGSARALPFLPFSIGSNGLWRWWCPEATRAGRCGIYESRPTLCANFNAGSDPLCVMHRPAPVIEGELAKAV